MMSYIPHSHNNKQIFYPNNTSHQKQQKTTPKKPEKPHWVPLAVPQEPPYWLGIFAVEVHWKRRVNFQTSSFLSDAAQVFWVIGAPPNHFPIWFGLVHLICAAKFLAGMWDFGSHLIKIGVNQIALEYIEKNMEAGWARLDWSLYRFWKPDLIKHTCHR